MAESEFNGSFLPSLRKRWEGYAVRDEGKGKYAACSPGSDNWYTVTLSNKGWSCTCGYAEHRKFHCKHIHAVENIAMLPEPEPAETAVLDPVPENTCPRCGAAGAPKAGVRRNRNYDNQRCECRSCDRKFSANRGFGGLMAPPGVVARAIDDFHSGKSAGAISRSLRDELAHPPAQQTVSNWIRKAVASADKLTQSLNPCLGEKFRIDGMYVKVDGEAAYLHIVIDDATRYMVSYMLTPNKATDDVSAVLREAERVAGKKPTLLVSDKDWAYHAGWKKELRARNSGWKKTHHHRHVHASYDINNTMERFNGTVRPFLDRMRGFKRANTRLLEGFRIHYNHVRPHEGLGGTAPGEVAGITVNGPKWLTLVQHASLLKNAG